MSHADVINVTVLIAVKNESSNLRKCLASLEPAKQVFVLDSQSSDDSAAIAESAGAKVLSFRYTGGYPKKRQWALDNLPIETEWVLMVDADEQIPPALWNEIQSAIAGPSIHDAYLITKGFHFLGQPFRFGGFSFAAVILMRKGQARFEKIIADANDGLDMEVHERIIVSGSVGKLATPLIHNDFKGLHAYLDRHNRYSTWEAALRYRYMTTGRYGEETITPRLLGNTQERRRWLKGLIIRLPIEPLVWFAYHYLFRLGFLEGSAGYIASRIRASYISDVRAKVFELKLARSLTRATKK